MIDIIVPHDSLGGCGKSETFKETCIEYIYGITTSYFITIVEHSLGSGEVIATSSDGRLTVTFKSLNEALDRFQNYNIYLISEDFLLYEAMDKKLDVRLIHLISVPIFLIHHKKLNYMAFQEYTPINIDMTDASHSICVMSKRCNENSYLDLLKDVLRNGKPRDDRTGTGTVSLFGKRMSFDLSKGFPLLTSKKVKFEMVAKELLWFISGSTDSKVLESQGVNIWKRNATKEFLENRGLSYREGDIGPMYGHQWRHAGAKYKGCDFDYFGLGVDQVQKVIDLIKTDPTSRRIIINSYGVPELEDMALEPCHVLFQFYVDGDEVSGQLYQRSGDMFLGVPFNIASYALLLHLICHFTKKKPKELIVTLGDAHIYKNHLEQVITQLSNPIYIPPRLEIVGDPQSIDDVRMEHIMLADYKSCGAIKGKMAV